MLKFLTVLSTFIALFSLSFISPSLAMAGSDPTRMIIPLYIYPGTTWNQVIAANTYKNIDVIVNPYNGADKAINADYVTWNAKLKAASVIVWGYTYTGWGTRSMDVVKADIDNWVSWYHVDGIFLDEGANTTDKIPYYTELWNYITSKGMKVMINPGTSTIEGYTAVANTNIIYESDPSKVLTMPTWAAKYPASEFGFMQYAATADQMRTSVARAKSLNIGYIYVTSGTSDYWSSLPPYLAEEASLLTNGTVVAPKVGDLDGDGDVDLSDYNTLVADFGKTGAAGFAPSDINKSGAVDIYDYSLLLENYGK